MLDRRRFLAAAGASLGCRKRRGTGFPGYALVATPEVQAVTAVDLTRFALAGHIRLSSAPRALAVHPARRVAWALIPENGLVQELDVAALRPGRKLQLSRSAFAMRLAPDGESLWVLCRDPRQLVAVDAANFQRRARIGLPGEPRDFDLSPDGRWAAISLAAGAVVFVDLAAGRAQRPLEFGFRAAGVRFRSDSKLLLAASADLPILSLLEVPSGVVVVHLPLAMRAENFCFKSDGGQLFVTGSGADAVAIVYPYRSEVAETVLAGNSPGAMAVSTAPDYLFVANAAGGDVTIMDIETRRVIALAAVGEGVNHITVTPDNQYVLALNERSGVMAVIRIAAIVARRTRVAPLFTVVPVGPRPVAVAVCRL